MYVGIDKEAALRMHGLVSAEWQRTVERLTAQLDTLAEAEKPPLRAQIDWMSETEMAVVVSAAQNEAADMAELGLAPRPGALLIVAIDEVGRCLDQTSPSREATVLDQLRGRTALLKVSSRVAGHAPDCFSCCRLDLRALARDR